MTNKFAEDFRDLNRHMLLLLQRVAQEDLGEATARFGVTRAFAEDIRDVSISKLQEMASESLCLFQPRPMMPDALEKGEAPSKQLALLRSVSVRQG
ncbi:flagellar transcriptional regulator FlhD (plasmid) [Azospirillum oryzae]|uniref:Flagellar transcriptional regulator FlhD n=1 Tax=Azospirillum oryzae TaxID=286727 RepID=A0A6N1AWW0_9PROT|nr:MULTISPECIES: flagellar transcriptional regulator FlhD [Azospirillum]KAA0584740.1 flagellar transcriptional regulator FlhD [Azospirillum oryzae]PWC84347.1 hypothetical protein TSO5_27960 [Azospirillum sp. TSO5]QCG99230.1 flagellar transcriptional regulator FlhD [Azospirillum sp. TSA2s]QKS54687.1 flagellar transcriptional regulator FlhD [Azospirillum oryzae]GLR77578.1 hypothetical protein GCM10007856_02460 [Azospirillum oryzae]